MVLLDMIRLRYYRSEVDLFAISKVNPLSFLVCSHTSSSIAAECHGTDVAEVTSGCHNLMQKDTKGNVSCIVTW